VTTTRTAALVAAWTLAGCTTSFDVPSEAQITCDKPSQCPDGYFCSEQIGVCVAEGGSGTAPSLTDFVLDGELFAPGDTIDMSFGASEPLHASSPAVELRWASQTVSAERSGSGGPPYRFTYLVADDPEGAVTIHVTLVDTEGNASEAEPKTVTIDATPPVLDPGLLPHELILDSGNLRFDDATAPTVAKPETRVRLRLTFAEPVGNVAAVATGPTGGTTSTLAFVPRVAIGPHVFEYEVDAADVSGSYVVEVTATDLAGNVATLGDAGLDFVIDTNAPQAPSSLSMVRTPWSDDSSAAPAIVSGNASDDDPIRDDLLRVHLWDRIVAPLELGRSPELTGAFDVNLVVDVSHVYASAVDAAGNESALALVDTVTWVASLAGRVIGDDASNPHRISRLRTSEPYLFSELAREPPTTELEKLYAEGDGVSLRVESARTWIHRAVPVPIELRLAGMAYIPTTGKTFSMGGMTSGGTDTGAFEWDGEQWRQLEFPEPSSRSGALVAYDEKRDRVVVFSGARSLLTALDDTWEWDGRRWHNPLPENSGVAPPGRVWSAAAYHPGEQKVFIFGGLTGPDSSGDCPDGNPPAIAGMCLLNDVWSWDGAAWSPEPCDGACPTPRMGHAMLYDEVEDQLVVFGGFDVAAIPGGTGAITPDPMYVRSQEMGELSPAWKRVDIAPIFRFGHGFVSSGTDLFVVGGCPVTEDILRCPIDTSEAPQVSNELLRWNRTTSTWDTVTLPATSPVPAARVYAGAVFDRGRDELLWVGGHADIRAEGTGCGQARDEIDECEGGTLMQGSGHCECGYPTTWAYEDGGSWRQAAGRATDLPDAIGDAALAYFESGGEETLVMMGGWSNGDCDGSGFALCDATWLHSGGVWERWVDEPPPCDNNNCPTPRTGASMALLRHPTDPSLNQLIAFGGDTTDPGSCATRLCKTWSWSPGTGWVFVHEVVDPTDVTGCQDGSGAAAPCNRVGGVLVSWEAPGASVPADTAVLLFGGRAPAAGDCGAGDCCPGSSEHVTNGSENWCYFNDLWKWDGVAWTEICGNCAPPPRWEHAMAFDAVRHRAVLFGGCGPVGASGDDEPISCNDTLLDDTWEWDETNGWTPHAPGFSPPIRAEHGMSYDPTRGRVIMFGGVNYTETPDSLAFEWNGNNWSEVSIHAMGPPGMREHGVAVWSPRSRLVAAAGELFWELPLEPDNAPAVTFDYSQAAMGVAPGSVDALSFVIHGSGQGNTTDLSPTDIIGEPTGGLVVEAWNQSDSRWEALACTPTWCDDGSACTCLPAGTPADYLFPGGDRYYVRARPRYGDGNGVDPSSVTIDYAELRVDYTYVP